MEELWPRFDTSSAGHITRAQFFAPNGLNHFLTQNLSSLVRGGTDLSSEAVVASRGAPDIKQDRVAWFTHFDEDGTGELAQEEIVRALIKTYKLASDLGQVWAMRDLVGAVWAVFASGDCVTQTEFLQADGLAEAIIAGLDPNIADRRSSQNVAPPLPQFELPPNIKQCPACGMLLEKVGGDNTMMCGCEGAASRRHLRESAGEWRLWPRI